MTDTAAGVAAAPGAAPLLAASGLRVEFRLPSARTPLRAVDDVSFDIGRREIFGLIGESGSGKSTIARAIMQLTPLTSGAVVLGGTRIDQLRGRELRRQRRRVQMVFQDPHEALDPRMTVRQAIEEPLRAGKRDRGERVSELLRRVGLDDSYAGRKPHTMSGGQKQRVNIARALALEPELLVCDEAVSALDVSVRAGIINLLMELQRDLQISVLFISHDLGVVAHLADRIGVLYLGRLAEVAPAQALLTRPRHPYTEALLAAEPEPRPAAHRGRRPAVITGEMPSAASPPSGCRFRTRCRYAQALCAQQEPPLQRAGDGTLVACHFAGTLELTGRRA